MGIVAGITALVIASVFVWQFRRNRADEDGVPAPIVDGNDADMHHVEGTHVHSSNVVRMRSSPAVIMPSRLARGSVPPPTRRDASEFVISDPTPHAQPTAFATPIDPDRRRAR